jgi:hypothetical protein
VTLRPAFLDDLRSAKLEPALDRIRERSGAVPEIELDVGAPLDKPELREAYSSYRFAVVSAERLELVEYRPNKQVIDGLEEARTMAALSERLSAANRGKGAMLWINLEVGLSVPISTNGAGDPWGARELWANVLEPLAPWVRPAW